MIKLGARVRVTGPCSLLVGTRGVVTWLSNRHASVLVAGQAMATVPLECLAVAEVFERGGAR